MFVPTTKHNESLAHIKIGSTVPPGAVNLAYYVNRTENNINNSSVFVSNAEKKTMDSIAGEKWIVKKGLPSKSLSIFPLNMFYKDDDGYVGNIKRKDVTWIERVNEHKKNITIKKSFTLGAKNAPESIEYNDGEYKGTLYLKSANYTPGSKSHTERVEEPPTKKFFSKTQKIENLSTPEYNFPVQITVEGEDGFSGILNKVQGKIRFLSLPIPTTIETITKVTGKVNGYFPSFLNEGGVTLYPTGEMEDKITEKIVKHYATCRYWGRGTHPEYYGNPNYRFAVGGNVARGYFDDSIPRPTTWRYSHFMKVLDYEEKYPIDTGGWYPPDGGIPWTYDIEEAMKYGGSSDALRGGVVWFSQYWQASGGKWPPPGYENDFLTANGIEGHYDKSKIVAGSSTTINHTAISLCYKSSMQKTSALGFRNAAGWYNKFFRDFIMFYKGKTTEKVEWAKYSGIKINNGGYKYTAYQDYEGYLEKKNFKDITVVDEWNAECEYVGIVNKVVTTYDGRAHYEGMVYKKTSIANIEQQMLLDNFYYVDTDGKLANYKDKNKFVQSEIMSVTDIFKDNVPLHNVCKLKYPIYIPNGPSEETILNTKYIKILNSKFKPIKKQKYLVKLIPTNEQYVYKVHILSSFTSNYNNPYYAVYDKHSKDNTADHEVIVNNLAKYSFSYLEKMSTESLYVQGKDFTITYDSNTRKSQVKFPSYNLVSDTRNKIPFTYVVKSIDGKYISRPISAYAINYKYALENEKPQFIGRKLIVSPIVNGITMTAAELIKENNPLVTSEILSNLLYTVELYDLNTTKKYKLNLYTQQDGNGPVTVETSEDTGLLNPENNRYTKQLPQMFKYFSNNNIIYPLLHVAHLDQQLITVVSPKENGALEDWFPRIQFSHFTVTDQQNNTKIQATYTMPEYDTQYFSTLGKPFVNITNETPEYINENHIRLRYSPLHIITDENGVILPGLINIRKIVNNVEYPLTIKAWFSKEGIIEVNENLGSQDNILVDYIYTETTYKYKGFTDVLNNFIRIDLNPNMYHKYIDNSSGACIESNTYNLFNKTIYFFFKPTKVEIIDTHEVLEENFTTTLYHKIDDANPDGQFDIMIGKVNLVPSSTLHSTDIIDTRVLGGGLDPYLDDKLRHELEPESDYYWNIGSWNGEPFPVNGVVLVRLDKRLLQKFTKSEIEEKVQRHIAYGVLPIIEYVTIAETTPSSETPLITVEAKADIVE